jgi:hypothetical protein
LVLSVLSPKGFLYLDSIFFSSFLLLLLNMLHMPLACTFFPSSIPMIHRLWRYSSCIFHLHFFILFLYLHLIFLLLQPCLQTVIFCFPFDSIYWRYYQLNFIWLIHLLDLPHLLNFSLNFIKIFIIFIDLPYRVLHCLSYFI